MKKLLPILVVVMLFVAGGVGYFAYGAINNYMEKDEVASEPIQVTATELNVQSKVEEVKRGWVEIDYFSGAKSTQTEEFKIPNEVSKVRISYTLTASKSTDMFFIDVIDSRTKNVFFKGDDFNGLGTFLSKSSESHQVVLENLVSGDYYNLDIKAFVDSWEVTVEGLYE